MYEIYSNPKRKWPVIKHISLKIFYNHRELFANTRDRKSIFKKNIKPFGILTNMIYL